jgi:hypothetical protein
MMKCGGGGDYKQNNNNNDKVRLHKDLTVQLRISSSSSMFRGASAAMAICALKKKGEA